MCRDHDACRTMTHYPILAVNARAYRTSMENASL